MSSGKCGPSCLGLNVLKHIYLKCIWYCHGLLYHGSADSNVHEAPSLWTQVICLITPRQPVLWANKIGAELRKNWDRFERFQIISLEVFNCRNCQNLRQENATILQYDYSPKMKHKHNFHNDVMIWKYYLFYWPFVGEFIGHKAQNICMLWDILWLDNCTVSKMIYLWQLDIWKISLCQIPFLSVM